MIGEMTGTVGAGSGGTGDFGAPSEMNGGGTPAGMAPEPPAQAGSGGMGAGSDAGTDGGADAGVDAATPTDCAGIATAFEEELSAAQDCSGGAACTQSYAGSGCSDGLFPLCGVPHIEGADLTRLTTLDHAYRKGACHGTDPVACADCALPAGAVCTMGRCAAEY
jgi:hypothetical protein